MFLPIACILLASCITPSNRFYRRFLNRTRGCPLEPLAETRHLLSEISSLCRYQNRIYRIFWNNCLWNYFLCYLLLLFFKCPNLNRKIGEIQFTKKIGSLKSNGLLENRSEVPWKPSIRSKEVTLMIFKVIKLFHVSICIVLIFVCLFVHKFGTPWPICFKFERKLGRTTDMLVLRWI